MKKLMMAVLGLALAGSLLADSAYSFTYQAALRDEYGNVITKGGAVVRNHTVTVRLWSLPTGGELLWGRVFNVYTDATGLFNLTVSDGGGTLNSETPAFETLEQVFRALNAGDVYVGLEVAGSAGEIVPRQRLLAVPFAAVANDVRKISRDVAVGGTITLGTTGSMKVTKDGIRQTSGTSSFNNMTVGGTLNAAGRITANNGLTVNGGTLIVNSDLSVASGKKLTAGSITASNGLTVNGGTLAVNTDLSVASGKKLTVAGSEVVPVPVGGIIMWTKSALPDTEHWAICNGQTMNGVVTPDLRDRFIVGAGTSYSVGSKGGLNTVTLTTSQMPSHRHYYVGDDQLAGIETTLDCSTRAYSTDKPYDAESSLNGSSGVYRTNAVGGGSAHENRPPYYALYYIMRVK